MGIQYIHIEEQEAVRKVPCERGVGARTKSILLAVPLLHPASTAIGLLPPFPPLTVGEEVFLYEKSFF